MASAGLGGTGSAQPIAVTGMLDGVSLIAEVDADKARRSAPRPGTIDLLTDEPDEALDAALAARAFGGSASGRGDRVKRGRAARRPAGAWRHPGRGHRPDRRPRPAQRLPAGRRHPRRGRRAAPQRPGKARGAGPGHSWSAMSGAMLGAARARGRGLRLRETTSGPTPRLGGLPEARSDHRHLHRPLPPPPVLPRDRSVSLDLPVGRGQRPRRRSTSCVWSCSLTCPGSPTGSVWPVSHVVRQGLPALIAWLGHGERYAAGPGGQSGPSPRGGWALLWPSPATIWTAGP